MQTCACSRNAGSSEKDNIQTQKQKTANQGRTTIKTAPHKIVQSKKYQKSENNQSRDQKDKGRSYQYCSTRRLAFSNTLWSLIIVPPLINFSYLFHPGHSYSNPPTY